MAELGPYLRGERERQGASLELMQQRTKIQRRYLQAIEKGDYGALPGAFYTRAFIRSYAEALGLNAEDIFRQYGGELPAPKQQPAAMPSRTSRKQTRSRNQQPRQQQKQKKTSFLPFVFALIFLLIIGAGIWLLFQNVNSDTQTQQQQSDEGTGVQFESGAGSDDEGSAEENAGSAENAPEENEEAGGEENESTDEEENGGADVQLEETSAEGDNASYDVIGAETFELTMNFSGDSYVDVTNAEGDMLDMFSSQSAGDELEETYEEEEITVNVGNTNNMELAVNGREFSYPSDGTHQRITFTAVPEE
ncbi:DUF4115 domain-containing protein [Marinococcus halophilus]|uniref:XRE family transcriptional regulator n=1 Tax=Marinococcus halophilus TaxID=1371 RepID=A0A510Y3N8_MARHA|nr:RodZ domain-containing protein [Marinococcus halophilus]OZT81490.1 DUF4115 domain-containing protein [Marinococcus halophilus]GEK57451.1 XRE family transcriptional regulator [Marinococcus halophilus]